MKHNVLIGLVAASLRTIPQWIIINTSEEVADFLFDSEWSSLIFDGTIAVLLASIIWHKKSSDRTVAADFLVRAISFGLFARFLNLGYYFVVAPDYAQELIQDAHIFFGWAFFGVLGVIFIFLKVHFLIIWNKTKAHKNNASRVISLSSLFLLTGAVFAMDVVVDAIVSYWIFDQSLNLDFGSSLVYNNVTAKFMLILIFLNFALVSFFSGVHKYFLYQLDQKPK